VGLYDRDNPCRRNQPRFNGHCGRKIYLTNTPRREGLAICESLLTNNAVIFKANSELVTNARKSKKSNKKLNIEARYLTKETV
jgi:hypothetical protein